MKHFHEMINKYSLRHNKKLNNFCAPILHSFGVNHFWYYKITKEGYYTCLGTNLPWTEYYFSENLYHQNPFIKSPENFEGGIIFIKQIEDQEYQNSIERGVTDFSLRQNLIFLEKIKDGLEGFGFASHLPSAVSESLFINEMPILKLFVKKFRDEFNPLLNKMSEDMVEIAPLIGPSFYEKTSSIRTASIDRTLFLKQFCLSEICELSHREKEVLFLVSRGLYAAQIAEHLVLSKRTVEHYIENIKNKIKCYSKAELIQKSNEYLSLGYTLP